LFGDKREIPDLMNAALDALHNIKVKGTDHFRITHVEYIYSNTVAGSPLRLLLVESFVIFAAFDSWFKEEKRTGRYHEDFLCDLLIRLSKGGPCTCLSIHRLTLWRNLKLSPFYVCREVVRKSKHECSDKIAESSQEEPIG